MTLDIESQLLGRCLFSPQAVSETTAVLHKSDIFLLPDNQKIYQAIQSLQAKCYEVDLISVNNELLTLFGNRPGAKDEYTGNWLDALAELTEKQNYFTGSVTHACYKLIDDWLKADLARLLTAATRELQYPDASPMGVMDSLISKFGDRQTRLTSLSEEPFSSVLTRVVQEAEAASLQTESISGVRTGLHVIDNYTKGLQPATLVVCAARPRVGKTAFAAQLQYNISVIGQISTAYFTLEVTAKQFARRHLSIDSCFKTAQIKSGKYSDGQRIDVNRLANSAGRIGNAPLWVYDNVSELSHITAKIRQIVREHGVQVVFIDQCTLVEAPGNDRRSQISTITRTLKKLANELSICVFLLTQISREADKATNPRPKMDQLKESGSLEEDADTVILLFRPALYGLKDANGFEYEESVFEVSIPKNRDGSAHNEGESEELWCDLSTNRIADRQPTSF